MKWVINWRQIINNFYIYFPQGPGEASYTQVKLPSSIEFFVNSVNPQTVLRFP